MKQVAAVYGGLLWAFEAHHFFGLQFFFFHLLICFIAETFKISVIYEERMVDRVGEVLAHEEFFRC